MNWKTLIASALLLVSANGSFAHEGKRFGAIWADHGRPGHCNVMLLDFDAASGIPSQETTLFIPEKDLKAAFDALAAPRGVQ